MPCKVVLKSRTDGRELMVLGVFDNKQEAHVKCAKNVTQTGNTYTELVDC
jgi:hypothetical protein